MCGICGELTFEPGAAVDTATLLSMRERLAHRGPDDKAVWVSGDRRAGLAFRRLAIIDLSAAANQPLPNEDDSVRVVFNGEIYNFKSLRADLESRGHRFRTDGDAETIVHLYEDHGADFVEKLDGMFAIGLWDARTRRLILARDRAGKKPLFYYRDAHRLVFGSEIKAILAHPGVPTSLREAEIPSYFMYGYVPHPATLYRDIEQVNPASVITVEADGRVAQRKYWRLVFPDAGAAPAADYDAARERVRELVTAAVARRLVSDVPLGAFLSAGIDSTIVVGLMSRLMNQRVKTFTIGFDGDAAYDETAAARDVAARFNTDHTEFRVKPAAVDLIDRLVWHHDGPFGDSSAIPTYLVSQLTREQVTVVLTGDGGDELFAGYLRFGAALAAERLPRAAGAVMSAAFRALPRGTNERHLLARARRFARFMHLPLLERVARWNSLFQDDVRDLLQPDVVSDAEQLDPLRNLRADPEAIGGFTPLGRLLAANFVSYLPDDLLVKTDRCTMANALEARAPLLDTALTEYAASLPDDYKLRGRTTKAVLRDAFADLLPPDIVNRPKTGFGVPLDAWFRTELRDFVRDTLLAPSAALGCYVHIDRVRMLIDDHLGGRTNAGQRLWSLVCFERWLKLLPAWSASTVNAL
jgi:asparagine synthase (glutamine-hydrolysing)